MKRNFLIRRLAAFLLLIICAASPLLYAGCGAGGGSSSAPDAGVVTMAATTMSNAAAYDMDGNYADNLGGGYNESGNYAVIENSASINEVFADEQPESRERKEIKNVNCQLAVKDVAAAYVKISENILRLGGYEFSKTESKNDGNIFYSLTIKLPPENLTEFEKSLRSVEGDNALKYFNLYSDDITSAYYDSAARLESMTASMRQYHALIAKAVNVKDMLEIQREITVLQAEIDSLQGQINVWNHLVGYATINLTIEREPDPLSQAKNEQWSFNTPSEIINSMGNGFIATGNIVYQVIVGLFVVIVSLLPALVPAGIIVLIILAIRRKRQKKYPDGKVKKTRGKPGGKHNRDSGNAERADSASVSENIAEAQQYVEAAKQYLEDGPQDGAGGAQPGGETRQSGE